MLGDDKKKFKTRSGEVTKLVDLLDEVRLELVLVSLPRSPSSSTSSTTYHSTFNQHYKSTNSDGLWCGVYKAVVRVRKVLEERMATEGSTTQVFTTQFTYFTSTIVQILRQKALPDEG